VRDVLEADQFNPAAHVLQGPHHLHEVAVAAGQDDAVELGRLQEHVHGQVEVGVGLADPDIVLVGVPLHGLLDDLEAHVADGEVEARGPVAVLGVAVGPVLVEGEVGVEADGIAAVPAGVLAQDVEAHAPAAVAGNVLHVHVNSDPQPRWPGTHKPSLPSRTLRRCPFRLSLG
jgi:hypothetical protein